MPPLDPQTAMLEAQLVPAPDPRRWKALAVLALVQFMIVIVVTYLNWRWIFFINAPIAVVAMALIPRLVDESKAETTSRRFDVPGAVLATGGVLALVDGFLAAARHPWGSFAVAGPLVGGILALLALVVVESRSSDPLIPLKFFKNRTRVSANVATA